MGLQGDNGGFQAPVHFLSSGAVVRLAWAPGAKQSCLQALWAAVTCIHADHNPLLAVGNESRWGAMPSFPPPLLSALTP